MGVKREVFVSMGWALIVTITLAVLIFTGSRNLAHFDAVLVGYLFATLFAAFIDSDHSTQTIPASDARGLKSRRRQ